MERNFCFAVQKYKYKTASLKYAYNHNVHRMYGSHINRELSDLNVSLVHEYETDYLEYVETAKERLSELGVEALQRRDAVSAVELIVRINNMHLDNGSVPVDFNLEEWARDTTKWVQETFNPKYGRITVMQKDGTFIECPWDNVFSGELHLDELSPHIHYMITPVAENGHFRVNRYFSKPDLRAIQDQYYESVGKTYGLARGQKYTRDNEFRKGAKDFYRQISSPEAAKVPEYLESDTREQYVSKVTDEFQRFACKALDKELRLQEVCRQKDGKIVELTVEKKQLIQDVNREIGSELSDHVDFERCRKLFESDSKLQKIEKALKESPDKELSETVNNGLNRLMQLLDEKEERGKDRSYNCDEYERLLAE